MNEDVEIKKVFWFPENMGVILAKDKTTRRHQIYIGMGLGLSERDDVNTILSWGNKIEDQAMVDFAKHLYDFATEKTGE